MNRPITTLFMLISLDGKISTGSSDNLDFDKDLTTINCLKEGLHQYYEIEQTTDLWSLNSGRVQSKLGVNDKSMPLKSPVSFVLIDNTHLNENGIKYFCCKSKDFILITSNADHPAFNIKESNLHIIYQKKLDLNDALVKLKKDYGCKDITIQTGGTLNSLFLREKLIDYVHVVIAPCLIGGKDTSTMIDGESLTTIDELSKIAVLELIESKQLDNSYLQLKYKVIN